MQNTKTSINCKLYLWLIAINIIVFFSQIIKGVDANNPALEDLVLWGANVAPLTLQGQSWRLFTNIFIHVGWIHLALNMYLLFLCGQIVERKFGSLQFLIIYILTGLFASLTSALWFSQHKVQQLDLVFGSFVSQLQLVVSAGASGAIMGITGAFVADWLVNHNIHKANNESINVFKAFAATVCINLGMGFVTAGVDNACHVGGLLAGLILGGLYASANKFSLVIKKLFLHGVLVAVGISLLYAGINLPVSADLMQLKTQLLTELADYDVNKKLASDKAKIADEVAKDAKYAPNPVDAKTAAGVSINLSQFLSKNAFLRDMQLTIDGKTLVILAGELDNKLLLVDVKTQKITEIKGPNLAFESGNCTSLMCEGKGADSLKLSADGRFAYVTSMQKDSLTIVDLNKQTILESMPAGQYPRAFAANQNNTQAFVTNGIQNTITVLDLNHQKTTGAVIKLQGGSAENLPFGHADGIGLLSDAKTIWALDAVLNQIELFNTTSLKSLAVMPLTDNFYRDSVITAENKLWIVGVKGVDAFDLNKALPNKNTAKPAGNTDDFYQQQNPYLDKAIVFCRNASFYDIAASPINNALAIAEDSGGYAQQFVHLIKTSTAKTVGRYPVFGPQNPVFSIDGKQIYVLAKQANEDGNASYRLQILSVDKTLDVSKADDEGELLCASGN